MKKWLCVVLSAAGILPWRGVEAEEGWPADVTEVTIPGGLGEEAQPAMFWRAPGKEKAPLLVGLHTWSSDYRQTGSSLPYQQWCRQEGWHFIHPNFGGANRTPKGMGSESAVADVVRAVAWAKEHAAVDGDRVYLVGVSGGGHMALLMAGRHPEIWAGVSAWCGISDIARWHAECRAEERFGKYAGNIEGALRGAPDTEERRREAARRSPVTWLGNAAGVALDIQAGVDDGRSGSVPFAHSLRAFNAVAPEEARLSEAEVERFYSTREGPGGAPVTEGVYGKRKVVFRREGAQARVTIFEGGHEILHRVALNWLAQQRKGQPAVWEIREPKALKLGEGASESGK